MQVVLGERKAGAVVGSVCWVYVSATVVLLVFLDGLFPCVFPSLVMRVGGVGCHPVAVLELGGVSM